MYKCFTQYVCVVQRSEEGIQSPETGVMDGCKSLPRALALVLN